MRPARREERRGAAGDLLPLGLLVQPGEDDLLGPGVAAELVSAGDDRADRRRRRLGEDAA